MAARSWKDMFPAGRHVYYEGDDPEGFRAEIRAEFGFDPGDSPLWGDLISDGPDDPDAFRSYEFDCPAEHLDAIYGSGRWRLGS
jgi:hypothetical protein